MAQDQYLPSSRNIRCRAFAGNGTIAVLRNGIPPAATKAAIVEMLKMLPVPAGADDIQRVLPSRSTVTGCAFVASLWRIRQSRAPARLSCAWR